MEDQPRCTRAKLGAHLFEGGMRRAMQALDMAMVEGLAQVENSSLGLLGFRALGFWAFGF